MLEQPTHVAGCDIRDRGKVEKAFAGAAEKLGPVHALVACSGLGGPTAATPARSLRRPRRDEPQRHLLLLPRRPAAPRPGARAAAHRRHVVDPRADRRAGLHGLQRLEGRAARPRPLARGRARAARTCRSTRSAPAGSTPTWPGTVSTAIAAATGGTREDAYRDAMRDVPLGRMSQPDDIAGTVAWLLSPDARGVTGQAIDQNGGAWMG